ncbi:group II intron-encoded protein ltrA [Trichonephila clavata]|uniref:Group II intron-encoded protein ltrA n=1 Tax=Trichonephila clavata TaxID=2740835 RepID=A0A8X6FJQ2_TRICU|nr:group II intron-encoded protein ltrA [Trichonephila clavata]
MADDLVILIDRHPKWEWLEKSVYKRLQEELAKLKVEVNEEKTKVINLKERETFSFLGLIFERKLQNKESGGYKHTADESTDKLTSKIEGGISRS